jgi:CheY-like chemotaxis protein
VVDAHAAADEQRARLAAIVESSEDGIIGKTMAGIVTSWNAAAERMFGYPAAEMIGGAISRLVPPGREREESDALDRIARGERVKNLDAEPADWVMGRDPRIPPRLVLLDIQVPKIDGLQVLKRLRADDRTKHVPVVILTSSREEADVVRSYALGANAYVRKPLEFAEFAAAAKTVGLFWLLLNEPPPVPSAP